MWPVDATHRVKLEYGHNGAALFAPGVGENRNWVFSRLQGKGIKFFPTELEKVIVQGTRSEISKESPFQLAFSRRQINRILPDQFVPSNVLYQASQSLVNFQPLPLVDPVREGLLSFGMATDYISGRRKGAYVYVNGPQGNIINIGAISEDSFQFDSPKGLHLDVPTLGHAEKVLDMREPIMGVKFAGSSKTESSGTVFCVRTAHELQFFRAGLGRSESKQSSILSADLIAGIPSQSKRFTDFNFNPWYFQQFAAIDENGSFGLFDFSEGKKTTPIIGGLIFSKNEKDSFCRVQWGSNLNNLVISNSKLMQGYDIRQSESPVMTYHCHPSTLIRQVVRIPERENELIILTSYEIKWIDLRMGAKELLAWKHYMSSGDRSLKCTVINREETLNILLYSSQDPVIRCFQFRMEDYLPVSLDDPYILDVPCGANTYELYPELFRVSPKSYKIDIDEETKYSSFLSLIQVSIDYSITQRVYHCLDGERLNSLDMKLSSEVNQRAKRQPLNFEAFTETIKPRVVNFHYIYKKIFYEDNENLMTIASQFAASEQCSAIAEKLNMNIKRAKFRPGPRYLSRYSTNIVGVLSNLEELSANLNELLTIASDSGFTVDHLGFGQLTSYFDCDGIDTQAMYDAFIRTYVRSLPADLTYKGEDDNFPVVPKARVRKERISRRIASDLALETVAVSSTSSSIFDTILDDEVDDSQESALSLLQDYTRFSMPKIGTMPITAQLAKEWSKE
ncbi:RNA polymerase I-specific transcription initiation factor RRN6-like protein [Lipomyces japonicus]|uniref:RNA polymerase I-specific transcription initiation factor RRN6-like protein n=1 Tax=Lipomyces japonicus TaxID=56871 RepID=UPI0034CD7323